MKKVALLVSLLFFLIPSSLFSQSVVFVSSSLGDDNNSGYDNSCPLRTISYALQKSDTIFLRSGDVFYETMSLNGKYVTSYGKGTRPLLCGYRRPKEQKWERAGENIWRLSLTDDNYTGFVVNGTSMSNDVGCIHNYITDDIYGRKVKLQSQMVQDWDIWQSSSFEKGTKPDNFDSLYLYLSKDPNKLPLEFSVRDGCCQMKNSTIEGISFCGFGFGVSAKSGVTIRNCRLDAIGGRTFFGLPYFTCYGNGIEFYVSEDISNSIVEGCYISRCYDCAVTIQAVGSGNSTPNNITVRDNLITNCGQGWEDFLNNNKEVVYNNCVFSNNVVLESGNSGFGYPKWHLIKNCHILGDNYSGDKGMIIRDNIFVGGNFFGSCMYENSFKSNIWVGNVCYISRDSYILCDIEKRINHVVLSNTRDNKKDSNDIKQYRLLTGDTTTKFKICSDRRIERVANRYRKTYIKKRQY